MSLSSVLVTLNNLFCAWKSNRYGINLIEMKREEELISIVVPVYNVCEYLDTCVESVINQTYCLWELILIDDESTDGSSKKCDEWSLRDKRIQVVHNQHCGPASARNVGIRIAKGDYLYFMDSDDWIEPDAMEFMLTGMHDTHADIVCCGIFFDYPIHSKKKAYVARDCVLSREEALKMIITGSLPSYLPLMLWRRDVVKEPYVDVPCYEDYATGYKWFAHARSVAMFTTAKYHYIQRNGSILHTNRKDKFLIEIYHNRHEYILQHQLMDEADSRVVTVKNFIKLAKDFARKKIDREERVAFACQVRENISRYLPVEFRQLGLKRWLRLQLLEISPSLFVRIV